MTRSRGNALAGWRQAVFSGLFGMSLACGGVANETGVDAGLTSASNGKDVGGPASSGDASIGNAQSNATLDALPSDGSMGDGGTAGADGGPSGDASADGDDGDAASKGVPEASDCVPGVVATHTYAVSAAPSSVLLLDANGDHVNDVAVTDGTDVVVFLGQGDGTLGPATNYPITVGPFAEGPLIAAGDLNGDGAIDLVAIDKVEDRMVILLGNGDGTFTPDAPFEVIDAVVLMVADVTGDGRLDVVSAGLESSEDMVPVTEVLPGDGDGTFRSAVGTSAGDIGTLGYFDKDPYIDFAIRGSDGVGVLHGYGDGTFDRYGVASFVGIVPNGLWTADLNRDMVSDLVLTGSFKIWVGLGGGDATFPSAQQSGYRLDAAPTSVAIADLNGDGVLDLVAGTSSDETGQPSHVVDVLLGKGDGTFRSPVVLKAGSSPQWVAAADMNGDGQTDIVVGNVGDATASVLLLASCGGTPAVPAPPSICDAGSTCSASATYYCGAEGNNTCTLECRCDAGEPLSCTGCP